MHIYDVQVPIFRWTSEIHCHILCRADALVSLLAGIVNMSGIRVEVGSVQIEENQASCFTVAVKIRPDMKAEFEEVVKPFLTRK